MTIRFIPVAIAEGQAVSDAVGIGDNVVVGIIVPSSWGSSASLSFLVVNGEDSLVMRDLADEIVYAAEAGSYVAVDPLLWIGVDSMKIRSGIATSEIPQEEAQVIQLVVRDLD